MKNFIWTTTTVLWRGVAAVSLLMTLFVPVLFDAPGSLENRRVQALALSIAATPVLFLLAAILPWVFRRSLPAGFSCCPFSAFRRSSFSTKCESQRSEIRCLAARSGAVG